MMGTRKENANLAFYSLLNTEEERKKSTFSVPVTHCINMLRIPDNECNSYFYNDKQLLSNKVLWQSISYSTKHATRVKT